MKFSNLLLGAGLIGAVALFIKKRGSLLQQANVDITGAKVKISAYTSKIEISAKINNPSNTRIVFNSATADVFYNDLNIGKINLLGNQVIAPNTSTDITIPVTISNLDVLSNLSQILQSAPKGVNITIKGKANFDFGSIPIDKTVVGKDPGAGLQNQTT